MLQENKELLRFLAKSGPLDILLIGTIEDFSKLQIMLPQATMQLVHEQEIIKNSKEQGPVLPDKKLFDYIIIGNLLEKIDNPEWMIHFFWRHLDKGGSVLANLHNVRHWSILKELMAGHWRYTESGIVQRSTIRFFALPEIIHLFETAQYKEIGFAAKVVSAPENLLALLMQCGFVNENNDLEVEEWLVKASKCDPSTEVLKTVSTAEVRRRLVFLLRRIENDIDPQENCRELWQLCTKEQIPASYLAALAQNAMLYPAKVLSAVALHLYEREEVAVAIALLQEGYKLFPENANLVYVLGSLLYLQKKGALAEAVLKNFIGQDDAIVELLAEIRRGMCDR